MWLAGCIQACYVEALCLKEALSWIKVQQLSKVIIESDAKSVVDGLYSNVPNISELGCIINSCRDITSQCNNVQVVYAPRSANSVAHDLAQNARLFSSNQVWQCPPSCIAHSLVVDFLPYH